MTCQEGKKKRCSSTEKCSMNVWNFPLKQGKWQNINAQKNNPGIKMEGYTTNPPENNFQALKGQKKFLGTSSIELQIASCV